MITFDGGKPWWKTAFDKDKRMKTTSKCSVQTTEQEGSTFSPLEVSKKFKMSIEEYQQTFEHLNEEFNFLKEKINILINKYSESKNKLENNFTAI